MLAGSILPLEILRVLLHNALITAEVARVNYVYFVSIDWVLKLHSINEPMCNISSLQLLQMIMGALKYVCVIWHIWMLASVAWPASKSLV